MLIPFLAVLANIAFWLAIFFAERYEVRRGLIPERKKRDAEGEGFLYMNDYSTASWGDYIGFSLIDFGATVGLAIFWQHEAVAIAGVGGFLVTLIFYFYHGRTIHRPGSLFLVQGRMSRCGKVHTMYYFVHATIAIWSLYALFVLPLPPEAMYPILLGGAIYLVAFLNDCRLRRFS